MGELLVSEVGAEMFPGEGPELIEATEHNYGLDEELREDEPKEGLEMVVDGRELDELGQGTDRSPEVNCPLVRPKPVFHHAVIKYATHDVVIRLLIFPDFDNFLVSGHFV